MAATTTVAREFERWYSSRKKYGGLVAKGTMAGALGVLERLREEPDLSIERHTAKGGAQIRGASGSTVKKILGRFGETRRFVAEGGRTNRGLRGDIEAMLDALRTAGFADLEPHDRAVAVDECQRFIVERIREFHSRQRIEFVFDAVQSTRDLIHQILATAKERNQSGQVAQYLVGAKLAVRFPSVDVQNEKYSTADQQTGRQGDFVIRDTAFHVTMAPADSVFERCRRNAEQGYRVFLLVSDEHVQSVRSLAKDRVRCGVAVESIESFVGQNIEEMAGFSKLDLQQMLFELFDMYNKRVDSIEIDKSVLIAIPESLPRDFSGAKG